MKKLGKIVLSVAVCSFAMLSFAACGKSDKEVVFDAFGTFMEAEDINIAEEMGMQGVFEKLEGKAYEAGIELTLEDSAVDELAMLKSASIEMSIASDPDEEKAGLELGVGMGGLNLVSAEGYFDKEKVAVKIPQLIDKVFVLDYSGDLLEKIKKSALVSMMEINTDEIEELVNVYKEAFSAQDSQTEEIMKLAAYLEAFDKETKAYSDFKKAIEVVAIDAEKFEINGKEKSCNGYEMVITAESMVDLCKEAVDYYFVSEDAQKLWKDYMESSMASIEDSELSMDEFNAEYDALVAEYKASQEEVWTQFEEVVEDFEMEVFIYDGEIASLSGAIVLAAENVKVEIPFEMVCTGGEKSIYENFELELDLTALDAMPITITRETESEKDAYETEVVVDCDIYGKVIYNLTYDREDKELDFLMDMDVDGESVDIKVSAALEELEKGKSFELDIDEVSVIYDGETMISLSGEFYVTNDVEVEMPSGTKVDILTDNTEELMTVMQELVTAVESFSSIFGY